MKNRQKVEKKIFADFWGPPTPGPYLGEISIFFRNSKRYQYAVKIRWGSFFSGPLTLIIKFYSGHQKIFGGIISEKWPIFDFF